MEPFLSPYQPLHMNNDLRRQIRTRCLPSTQGNMEFKVVLLCCVLAIKYAGATMCYKCGHVAHPRDCDKVVECNKTAGEVCHVVSYAQPDGHFYYVTGCLAKKKCPKSPGFGRRDIAFCNRCCDGEYCNKELCDGPAPTTHGPRCLKCDTVEHPSHCLSVAECAVGQQCFTSEKYVFGERRYQLGCTAGSSCVPSLTYRSLLDKRAGNCLQCCSGENCNRNLCLNTGSPVSIAPVTVAPNTIQTALPTLYQTRPDVGPTYVYHFDGCHYKGRVYHTGDKWDDGCVFRCTCINTDTGRYTCQDMCPTYINVPAHCTMEKKPGECCSHPVCHGTGITITNYTSSTLINECFYQGKRYRQGETWRDGCQFDCQCTDASRGYYHCKSLCYTWNLPEPPCHLDPPAAGKCCKTPSCPSGFTIRYPPGYVAN